jgi:hypothetical protein
MRTGVIGYAMTQLPNDALRQTVQAQYGGTATFVQAVKIHEEQHGKTLWDGTVSVFDLRGSSSGAFRAYAWYYELSDGKPRFFSVLHSPNVLTPKDAVRSAIATDAKPPK